MIQLEQWDKARWRGMLFAVDPTYQQLPILGLLFEDADTGKAIVRSWRKELGEADTHSRLRITIVRGINRAHPHWYRVVVSTNPQLSEKTEGEFFAVLSRIHTMEAESSENLDRFLTAFGKLRKYNLMPAYVAANGRPDLVWDLPLAKTDLEVLDAWRIGPENRDASGVSEDDDPVIPPGVEDAPVLALQRWMREMARESQRRANDVGPNPTIH